MSSGEVKPILSVWAKNTTPSAEWNLQYPVVEYFPKAGEATPSGSDYWAALRDNWTADGAAAFSDIPNLAGLLRRGGVVPLPGSLSGYGMGPGEDNLFSTVTILPFGTLMLWTLVDEGMFESLYFDDRRIQPKSQKAPGKITIRSEPEGANVLVNGKSLGVTPCGVEVVEGEECTLELRKAGYRTVILPPVWMKHDRSWGQNLPTPDRFQKLRVPSAGVLELSVQLKLER